MLVLGNVRKIHAVSIDIELPGKVYGCLKIDSVSDQFIQLLQKQLKGDSTENDGVSICNKMLCTGPRSPNSFS